MKHLLAATVLAGAVLAPAAVAAQENCPALKQVAHIPLVRSRDGQSWVAMQVNSTPLLFKLDTAGVITTLYPEAVADLKLSTRASRRALVDINGSISNDSVRVSSVELGEIRIDRPTDMMVLPSRNPGYETNKRAGNLALDLLSPYDIELDYAASSMNLFSPDHCPGRVVYWQAEKVSEIPFQIDAQGWIRVPVKLDGEELSAIIDTGAPTTILNLSVGTRRLDLDLEAPDVRRFGAEDNPVYRKRFSTLELNGISVANPFVTILPDKMGERVRATIWREPQRAARLPDLIIGTSILNRLHIYIAMKEKKLYISAANPPSANADPAPQIPESGT